MANHDLAIKTLLDNGFRLRQLDNCLASNCVLDWFGRTFIGQNRVIDFYQNSNTSYEHVAVGNAGSTEAIEERPYHLLTREQPLENLKTTPDLAGDEQWFDCATHSPVDLKSGNRTPVHQATPSECPGAPCRRGLRFKPLSDDEIESDNSDDDFDVSGIQPFDTSVKITKERAPECKRLRRDEPTEEIVMESSLPAAESKYSDLFYLEVLGSVTINRLGSTTGDEPEKRDCRMLVSYRVNRDDPTSIQIALIIYKSNSKNPKTRRNLMVEFGVKEAAKPSTSRCRTSRTAVKEPNRTEGKKTEISSAPSGSKHLKATKRPMISKTSLRF